MIKILIGGDFSPSYRIRPLLKSRDFSFLEGIKPLFNSADFRVLNFETTIASTDDKPLTKYGPNLKTDTEVLDALDYLGVNLVTLANNHTLDYGEQALLNTINSLHEHQIGTVGAGENVTDSAKPYFTKIQNKVICFINCCEHEFSIAGETSAGANHINPVSIYYQIQSARKTADYIFVICHCGHEHFQLPSLRMVENFRFFIDAGADAVINHHQHCFSGYETYQNKPIFYGIGNFCFDRETHTHSAWNDGYLVQLNLDESIDFEIHPYLQFAEEPAINLLSSDAFDECIANLNMTISDTEMLKRALSKYYDSQKPMLDCVLEPYVNKYLTALRYRHLIPSMISNKKKLQLENFLFCESHFDKLRHYLKKRQS